MTLLQERSKALVASFIQSFEKLIRFQHLFISRIISMHIDQKASAMVAKNLKKPTGDYHKEATRIRGAIDALVVEAKNKIAVCVILSACKEVRVV